MGHHARLRLTEDAHSHSMSKKAGGHLLSQRGLLGNVSERHSTAWRDYGCDVEVDNGLLA
jgi:hypothetical protein